MSKNEEPPSQELTKTLVLKPNNAKQLAMLCGQLDENIRQLEKRLNISILNRGNSFQLDGGCVQVEAAAGILSSLYQEAQCGTEITPHLVHLTIQETNIKPAALNTAINKPTTNEPDLDNPNTNIELLGLIKTRRGTIRPRGKNQLRYVHAIQNHDLNFGIGPAGTGKTYLAVANAVAALEAEQVRRIVLVRPAVEAGEKLGFLPGDLNQKIDPYLRPLYDALYEMLGFDAVGKLIEKHVIEIAPLAYMRGRTLNNAFIILDEGQNTTKEQMKMFLTRIGFGSSVVITGDLTQIDLPKSIESGLRHATKVLGDVDGIQFTQFASRDVVRHPLVQRIVEAYDTADARINNEDESVSDSYSKLITKTGSTEPSKPTTRIKKQT